MKPLTTFQATLGVTAFALLLASAQASVTAIDFDDVDPFVVVTDQYKDEGVTFALIDGPIAGPESYPLDDADGTPVNVCGAEGNVITAGLNPLQLGVIYEVEMSFSSPIDFFSILAIDNEEGMTVVAYEDGEVVASTSTGTYVCTFPGSPVGGYFRGPVHIFSLGAAGGGVTFDTVMLKKVGSDMAERFDNLQFNIASLHVDIDIVPGDDSNCYNLNGKGGFPVVIFGNENVSVNDIDATSITVEGMPTLTKKRGRFSVEYGAFNDDGYLDMQVYIADDGSLNNFSGTATLEAFTRGGALVVGTDYLCDMQFCRDDD